jgi:hypothetical protein
MSAGVDEHLVMHRLIACPPLVLLMSHLLSLSVCAAATSDEEIQVARDVFFDCQIANLDEIDDKVTDATIVALNLTNLCIDEYKALNRVYARHNLDTSNERRMFVIERNVDIDKIDASLPLVTMNRNGDLAR